MAMHRPSTHSDVSAPLRRLHRTLAAAALMLPALPVWPSLYSPPTTTATTISMGTSHGCSVADTGQIACWGSAPPQVPQAVLNGERAHDLKVGPDFSCALFSGSAVRCWGNNDFKQLGTLVQRPYGLTISGLPQHDQMAVGARHACAVSLEMQVYCWGDASQGQIGSAVPTATTAEAVRVEGMSQITQVAAGQASTCGVMDVPNGRKVICVGAGSGLAGAADDPRTPRTVPGITDAREVSVFDGHGCVLRYQGKISCWGSNRYGELGAPASGGLVTNPVEVPGLGAPAKAVAVGDGFTCALLEGGTIKCWGNNANGQLGIGVGPGSGSATPATGLVLGISNAIAVSAGKTAACAALEGGYVQCWGEGAGWSCAPCRVQGGLYPGAPASYGPVVDDAMCLPQGSAAPMAVTGLGPANDAAQVLDWAEKTLPQTFPHQPSPTAAPSANLYQRDYPGGHRLAINAHGTPRLLYAGPLSPGQVADLGPLSQWIREAALHEGLGSGLQLQAGTHTNAMPGPGPCAFLQTVYGIRGGTQALPEGLMSSSVQVTGAGRSVEHPIQSWYRKTIMTNDTDWISPGTHIPGPGTRLEPVHLGTALGCSPFAYLQGDVEVIVFYTVGSRKGALRTRAVMSTSQ